MKKQNGFIIPLVLMLISIALVLATNIYQKGSIFVPFMSTIMKRNQARRLALSGMQVAMSQLAQTVKPKADKNAEKPSPGQTAAKAPSAQEEAKAFLGRLLPLINRWQEFKLTKDTDGVDGTIKIALSSEEGKINLNSFYDFARSKFVGEGQSQKDWKKTLQLLSQKIQKSMGISANLFESFEKFFKQRQYKVNDATELLPIDGFKSFAQALFYEPPSSEAAQKRPLYLLDMFTVYGNGTLQPWLLSDSVRGLFDMKRTVPLDEKQRKEMSQTMLKNFKSSINLAQDWKTSFQPIYGIEFNRIPKGIEAFFSRSFDPRFFSVVSYGMVGDVSMRLYAILERIRHVQKDKSWYDVKIRKFYWI